MAGKYQAYSEYKFSGFEWLGDVPEQWNVISLKQKFRIVGGSTPKSDQEAFWDGEFIWVTPSDLSKLPSFLIDDSQRKITLNGLNSCGTTLVPKNSIVLSTRAPIGSLAIANVELCTNQGCKSLVPLNGLSSKFIAYLLSVSTSELNIRGKGTTFLELSGDELGSFKIPFPSENEQQKIANFLDHETAKIDTLIEKQQQLIKLLKEKRQAVISHAVTKGLNPNSPMRDSGVEWLGEVPAHWTVSKFNYEIDFLEGPGILAYDFFEEGIPLLRIQDVKEAFVTDNYKTYLSPSKVKDKWGHFRVELGDLIISCSASTGLVSEVDSRSVGAIPYTGLIRLRPISDRITKDYIFFIVQSDMFFEQINTLQTGSTMQHFGPYHLQQMHITLPSMDEQKNVVKHIKKKVADIDCLIVKADQAVELMQERRKSLISAAVTGKIDVRNWHVA